MQQTEQEIMKEMVKLVRDTIGPVAAFRKVLFVLGLPKTRSGKIPRSSLANLVNGKPYKVRRAPQGNTLHYFLCFLFVYFPPRDL